MPYLSKRKGEIVLTELNLDLEIIDENILVTIISEAEEILRKHLEDKINPRFIGDLNIVITADKNDKLTFTINVGFSAPKILELEYDKIVEEAVSKAYEEIETRLKKYAKKHQ